MKAPFRLRHRSQAASVAALLLPAQRADELLRLLARLLGESPRVHRVADGYLLKLPRPFDESVPGAVRLRALANDLLLPVDAELVPDLLADEAAALVRQRGLVFLPGGRVLEYAPGQSLPLSALLTLSSMDRSAWQPLPEPPALADHFTELVCDLPDETPEAILEAGGEGIATEEPRPADSSTPATAAGRAAFGLGQFLARLGKKLKLRGLARAGANLMNKALSWAPALSTALLGRQEASLRELLRLFREGKTEQALRRAIPLSEDGGRGATAGDARLPTHEARYSLGDLLDAGGAGGLWVAPLDVFAELRKAYRQEAERAAQAGDYRRAAFIHGKLLRDYRTAAVVLAQGGLHHDAAVLYEKKLLDLPAAAREYEAAGDIEWAITLYRRCGEHARAGDLLRDTGEEELALTEYQLAVGKLLAHGADNHFEAGELLRLRARRADLALPHYEKGWARRPAGAHVPCALRVARHHAEAGDAARLHGLVGEAERFFRPAGNDTAASEFYNEIATLADLPTMSAARDDLRDQALLGIASKIRQQTQRQVKTLPLGVMGPGSPWPSAVVSDVHFAARQISRRGTVAASDAIALTTISARIPSVTAVVQAPEKGTLFLGFESGEVILYRPPRGEIVPLIDLRAPVLSLATDLRGDTVIALSDKGAPRFGLTSLRTSLGQPQSGFLVVRAEGESWLCPLLAPAGNEVVGLWNGAELQFLHSPLLAPLHRWSWPEDEPEPRAGLLLPSAWHRVLTFDGEGVTQRVASGAGAFETTRLGWCPCVPAGATLGQPLLAWLLHDDHGLELAGIGKEGLLCWSRLECEPGMVAITSCKAGPYRAAALVRPGLVAAVTRSEVQWLDRDGPRLRPIAAVKTSFPDAVACFAYHPGSELIVICGDGTVARVPMPRTVSG